VDGIDRPTPLPCMCGSSDCPCEIETVKFAQSFRYNPSIKERKEVKKLFDGFDVGWRGWAAF